MTVVLFIVVLFIAIASGEIQVEHQQEQVTIEHILDVSLTASSPCICTTVPCPQPGYNNLTLPGGSYATYYYVIHNTTTPVVSSVRATVTMANMDTGSDTTSCTQSYSRMLDDDGVQDCDAGHILAHRLGGPGNQPLNIFPQDLSINRGAYAQYESQIYGCIMYEGATSAALSWSFSYDTSATTKPNKVTYRARFTGGNCPDMIQTFTNQ